VRRPLRFLAWKLELEEEQVTRLAVVIEALKTERAQADVDSRRATAALARVVEAESVDAAALAEATRARVAAEERRQQAVGTALGEMHAMLDAEQRKRLAYLLRTGAIQL
jgi:Spy/CpxP family protein refolding chaperone